MDETSSACFLNSAVFCCSRWTFSESLSLLSAAMCSWRMDSDLCSSPSVWRAIGRRSTTSDWMLGSTLIVLMRRLFWSFSCLKLWTMRLIYSVVSWETAPMLMFLLLSCSESFWTLTTVLETRGSMSSLGCLIASVVLWM